MDLTLNMVHGTGGLTTKGKTSYDSYMLADPYLERLRDGRASLETLDDKAGRVLKLIFRTAMNRKKPFGSINSPEHLAAARQIGADGIVLLKNDAAADGSKVLPVDPRICKEDSRRRRKCHQDDDSRRRFFIIESKTCGFSSRRYPGRCRKQCGSHL